MRDPYKANWLCHQVPTNTNKTEANMYSSYNTSLASVDASVNDFFKSKGIKKWSLQN